MKFLISIAVIFPIFQCIQVPKTTDFDQNLHTIQINEYHFHIKKLGNENRPPIIVIHGGPGGDFKYLLPLEELSDSYQVLFYDQRMSGLSPRKSEKEPSPEQDIEDLHNIINQFAPGKKVILLGHSYGAMLASGYIGRYSDKVSRAVIMEPGILTKETAPIFIEQLKEKTSFWVKLSIIGPLIKSLFVKTVDGDERMDYILTQMMGKNEGPPYQCPGVYMPEDSFVRVGFSLMKKTIIPLVDDPSQFHTDLVSGLENYKNPVLLLSSSCSFIGYEYQEKYHRKFYPKQTEHIKLENTGHNFITTDPEKSIPIIRQFLSAKNNLDRK